MTVAFPDRAAWTLLAEDERFEYARKVAERLGDGFDAEQALRGRDRLASVRHRASGIPFVLVPSQTVKVGLDPDERRDILAIAPERVHPLLAPQLDQASPARTVTIAAFGCAVVPLLETMAAELVARWNVALRPEFSGRGAVPCHLTGAEARGVLERHRFRLLSEAEWECVAREGGTTRWLGGHAPSADADASDAIRTVAEHPERDPSADEPEHAFGVWGLAFGEWVADGWHDSLEGAPADARAWEPGKEPQLVRGGAATMWPWRDDASFYYAHVAARHRARHAANTWGVRFAFDLPAR